MLAQPPSRENMQKAAEALDKAIKSKPDQYGHSPVFCTLALNAGYPTAVPLKDMPAQVSTNPEFYELMRKIYGEKEGT